MRVRFDIINKSPFSLRTIAHPDNLTVPKRNGSINFIWPGRQIQAVFTNKKAKIWTINISRNCMEPAISDGDEVKFREVQYLKNDFTEIINPALPKIGDVVAFWDPEEEIATIKRVIGLPNDMIKTQNGIVFRNCIKLEEPYAKQFYNVDCPLTTIPKNHIFVLADNRQMRGDSRDFGPLSLWRVFGIVLEVIRK
jgi:signal peptidase I